MAIARATESYRAEQDVVANWLAECCVKNISAEMTSNDLYLNFKTWCDANGQRVVSAAVFGRRLNAENFNSRRSNGKTIYVGLELIRYPESDKTLVVSC
jgi:putative DNA primase/helicase